MKYLTYADRSVLIGDDAADLLVRYSAVLAETGHADSVALNVLSQDGDDIVASFVLGTGTNLMTASTSSKLPEPVNEDAVNYMKGKLDDLTSPHNIQPDHEASTTDDTFDMLHHEQ
jgi:hypothetical protein